MKLLWLNVSAIIIAILTNLNSYSSDFKSDTLSIDGIWRFQLDPMGFGKTPGSELCLKSLSEIISLPGSTDTNGKGFKNTASYIDRLTRKYEYYGMAWYQREIIIPESWCNRDIQLHLERCHWFTTVYVDGIEFPTKKHLSTPNRWDLTEVMSPGRHILTICIDNRIPFPMDHWNHGTTEYTQTNWNGVTGNMILTAKPKSHIINMQIYPDIHDNSVKIRTQLKAAEAATLHMDIISPDNKKKHLCQSMFLKMTL